MDFDNTMDFDTGPALDLVRGDCRQAANLLAAARPGPAGRPIADGWRLAWLARWAPLIRLARNTNTCPDPDRRPHRRPRPGGRCWARSTRRWSSSNATPTDTRRRYLQPALRRVFDDIDTVVESGPVSLPALLDTIAGPWPLPGVPAFIRPKPDPDTPS